MAVGGSQASRQVACQHACEEGPARRREVRGFSHSGVLLCGWLAVG